MKCKTISSLVYCDPVEISLLAGDNLDFSYGLLLAIEKSLPYGIWVNYLLVEDFTERLLAFIPIYIGRSFNFNALAPGFIQAAYQTILKELGQGSGLNVAVAGCPISDKGFVPMRVGVNKKDVLKEITQAIDEICDKQSVDICIFKDIHESVISDYEDEFYRVGYKKSYSLPTCVIDNDFTSFSAYKASLSKNGRKHCKKVFRKAKENDIRVITYRDFSEHLGEACYLFRNTFLKAKYKFDELSPQFFYEFTELNDPKAELIVRLRNGNIVGALLNIYRVNQTQLIKRIGIDYKQEDTALIYMLLNYHGIKNGIDYKVSKIYLGQSTYIPKSRIGAKLEDQYLLIKSYKKYLNPSLAFQAFYGRRYKKENVYTLLEKGVSL